MSREYNNEILKKLQGVELEILKDFIKLCDENDLEYFGIAGTGIGAIRHKGFIPWDDDIDIALPRSDYDKFLKLAKEQFEDKYTVVNAEEFKNYPLMTTRLMKKGTKFREFALKDIDCELGIFLDIYAFDNMSDEPNELNKQARDAWFWSKLMILRRLPFPVIPFKGIKKNVVHGICWIIHWVMVILRISPEFLYKKCKEACTRHNNIDTKIIGYLCSTSPYSNMIEKSKLYPLKKLQFEDIDLNFPNDINSFLISQFGNYMELPPKEKRKNHFPFELDFGKED